MIIGFSGFIDSGKSTVANILVAEHGYKKLAFADTLKDTVAVMFGWPRHLLEGDTEESRAFRETRDEFWSARLSRVVTPRWVLQDFGTTVGRNYYHQNFWVFCLQKKLQEYDDVAIPDVRFPNEAEAIRKSGGYMVRIRRGPDPVISDLHVSETAWLDTVFDYTIENENLSELSNQVKTMLKKFQGELYC
jgi:hypothetical protein